MLPLRDSMDSGMRHSGGRLPEHIATDILALIERLQSADGLCHGDLHPGNVIMTAEGPRLIDWMGMVRGPAALDLASTHFLLAEIAPLAADDPERPRAVNAALQAEYARLAGMSQAALRSAIDSYLPVAYARALFGGAMHAHQERLIQRIEAALRAE
jgi:aminoglycoside phosphotransferase (APT) family kinase protein